MKYREFDQTDWYGFAGATLPSAYRIFDRFDDGSPPLMGLPMQDEVIVIADRVGLYVAFYAEEEDGEEVEYWALDLPYLSRFLMRTILESLPDNITEAVLDEYGFRWFRGGY